MARGSLVLEQTARTKQNVGSPEELADLFPRLLTQRRFDEWAGLFADGAVISRVEAAKPMTVQSVVAALPEQIAYSEENEIYVESWRDVSIVVSGRLAVVTAHYTLTAGDEIRRGKDVLTLVDNTHGWQIVSLAYEQHELSASE